MKSQITVATVNIPFVGRTFTAKLRFVFGAAITVAGASVFLTDTLRIAGFSV